MRYVQLRAFHYVAMFGGFSRAAEQLFLTQPAISDQVRKLEEEYDILLFSRHRRQVELTPAGHRLLDITKRLFDSEEQALDLLSESRALRAGTLRIVADSAHHVLHILAAFRERHPGVRIALRVGNSDAVTAGLREYDADLGVLGEIPAGREFACLKLHSAPIIAFVAADHPAATRRTIRFADLAKLPLVMRERGSKTRLKLEDAARMAGVELACAIEAEGREAVREIVASGAGVGFVSAAEFAEDSRLVRLEISPADGLVMDEALICLRERRTSKLVQAFFDIAAAMLRPEGAKGRP